MTDKMGSKAFSPGLGLFAIILLIASKAIARDLLETSDVAKPKSELCPAKNTW